MRKTSHPTIPGSHSGNNSRVHDINLHLTGRPRIPPLADIEKRIGIAAYSWKARCYEISCQLVDSEIVKGTAVYGHWIGPIAETSFFGRYRDIGFCHHGWVLTKGGWVVDPTRWVFEDVKPYIYVGHPDVDSDWYYDEGGNQWRKDNLSPPPKYSAVGRRVDLRLYDNLMQIALTAAMFLRTDQEQAREYAQPIVHAAAACGQIRMLFGDALNKRDPDALTIDQAFWLANAPYQALGPSVWVIYQALERAGQGALIPFDNLKRAEREYGKVIDETGTAPDT